MTNPIRTLVRFGITRRADVRGRRVARTFRGRSIGALLVAGLVNGGCYRYVPVPITSLANDEVRVEITPAAAMRLAGDLGVFSTEIDGRLDSERQDSVSIHVPIERAYRGMAVGTTDQLLLLGRSEVVAVRKREFARGRTTLVSVGAVVGFGLLAAAVVQLADPNRDSQDPTPPPPPSASRIPSGYQLRVRIPIP